MPLSIFQATPTDAETLGELVHGLLNELSDGEAPDLLPVIQTTRDLLEAQAVTGFLAFDGDAAVGALTLHCCAAIYAGGHFGEISELFVLPSHRSAGVAAALLDQARSYGRSQDWKRLEVGAPPQPDWARTLAFYEREGFQITGPRLRHLL